MPYLLTYYVLDLSAALVSTHFGIRILSLAAWFGTAANPNTLADGLAKISAAQEYDGVSLFSLTPEWEEKRLKTSIAHSTVEAYEYVLHLDHAGRIADSPRDKKQKAAPRPRSATRSKNEFFSLPIATRASKMLGPISRHLITQTIPMICNAARASRPGLAVGIPRVLCNGLCTAQRFHMDDEEQNCRVGCPNETDSLSHYNECPLLYSFFIAAWKNALDETICFTTSSLRPFFEAFSMELWLWVLSTPLFTLTTITAVIWIIQGKENSTHDCYHPDIPVPLPGWTPACCSSPNISLAGCQRQISESSQLANHNT